MRCSKFTLAALAAFGAIASLPATANASQWWLIFGQGDKPEREVHYLNLETLDTVRDPSRLMSASLDTKLSDDDLIDYIQIEGVAIYESAKAPAKVATRYRVKCREAMVAKTMVSQLWRHDKIEDLPDQGYAAIGNDALLSQVHSFACAPTKREANGMMPFTDQYDTMPLTWSALWPDGVEPQWTSTRSIEERKAEIDIRIAKAREQLAKDMTLATATLQKSETDREQTIRDQQKLFSQMRQKASPVLHSWMGLPESALIAGWGIPAQSFDSGGSRFLYYVYGYTSELVDQYGNEFPQETWACHMTFEVRDGLIADYRSQGNYCQTAASNLPYGRARE
ncbi:hypothetical protein [Sphingorhabdus sp.]|jgi:hypothetical protein|uniref:hypothetical protein n=3 Tax=Sphingorhabdus sp. TaxID=1902408 RepID=UPI003BB0FB17|nr:hypothetical protein [Sphingomonadales bacterium]MBK9431023.1 hypothetical protein [Sphingomonadales bacterium]MBL0021164.1 hypothetical protein [Sphingomonadales bacterium]